ncbi:MAG: hypothetical protein R3E79_07105 [Caldilineaceae bacterium]
MTIQNPYDYSLKILARTYPEHFLRLGFPMQPMKLIGTLSNVELALEIDRVDFLHEIELNEERAYIHVDFQLTHTGDCPRRFFVYNGMLSELKKPYPIITLPVYLRRREKTVPNRYEVKVGGIVFHTFTYQPIQLWEHVDQIRSGELYVFAPLLPLLLQSVTAAALVEERRIILDHEQDPAKRRTLLTTAILVAAHSKLFTSDFLWELFKEDEMRLSDDPTLNKLYEKIFAPQFERTIQETVSAKEQEIRRAVEHELALAHVAQREAEAAQREAEAAQREAEVAQREAEAAQREAEAAQREAEAMRQWQETLLKILEHRFQQAPIQLWRTLQQVPVAKRNQVTDLVLDVATVEELLTALNQLMPKPS